MKKRILVTGGMGYIGSHTVVELLNEGYEVVIIDDLSNSKAFVLDRIEMITLQRPLLHCINLCDLQALSTVFENEKSFDIVIHFAASKSVAASVQMPLQYFQNNLISLLNLLHCMKLSNCRNIVFSSSATVYGDPDELPVSESSLFKTALSAYGSTKQIGEEILEKIASAGIAQVISLRYFNPVGAHGSHLIGELPSGTPNNLMPYITQTAIGKLKQLTVYGDDYATPDGSCQRDYIHVVDLAKAHVISCERLLMQDSLPVYDAFNIGTGQPVSVLELIKAFEHENAIKLDYTIGPRRHGDAAAVYADVKKANTVLKWAAEKGITEMVKDSWEWERKLYQITYQGT